MKKAFKPTQVQAKQPADTLNIILEGLGVDRAMNRLSPLRKTDLRRVIHRIDVCVAVCMCVCVEVVRYCREIL